MQCLCRLVYTRCISVHWLNKVPARKSHIDSLCQDLLAVQIVGTTKEHVQKVPMNTWEWKSREPKLLLICRQADLQATLPLNKHSKTQGLRTHREELSYLAEWQGLKDLLSPAWPELGSMIWSPGASMGTEILLHNPQMVVSTLHKSRHAPQLYRFLFSLMPIIILGHNWLSRITSLGY